MRENLLGNSLFLQESLILWKGFPVCFSLLSRLREIQIVNNLPSFSDDAASSNAQICHLGADFSLHNSVHNDVETVLKAH